MIILSIKTDQPLAEFGLFDNQTKLVYITYEAHRSLAETMHQKIIAMLKEASKDWPDIEGIVAFKGPGSFTGLRIGLAVANTLSYSLKVPIVGEDGDDWLQQAINKLLAGTNEASVMPEYGSLPHITKPKK